MFIVWINSNKLMNAGQIPTNRRDHVGVVLDRGPRHWTHTSSEVWLTQSREYAGENIPKYSLLH